MSRLRFIASRSEALLAGVLLIAACGGLPANPRQCGSADQWRMASGLGPATRGTARSNRSMESGTEKSRE